VTLYEALEELGIGHDASAAEARRAYLKLLKQRRPETDPSGFMRLREAYDTAKPHLESRDAFRHLLEAPHDPPAPVPPDDEVAEPPAIPVPVPTSPEVAEPTDEGGQETDASSEEEGDHDQDATGKDEPDPPDEATVDMLIAAGAHVAAAEELDRLFAAAARHVHGPVPPVQTAIRLILTLHAQDALDAAASLHASLASWLRASGQEARVIRGDVAARWTLVREIASLPRSFPGAMRAPIARAILAGDLGQAKADLDAFRLRKPSAARTAASVLRTSAPVLASAVAAVLDPPVAAPTPPAPARGGGSSGWHGGGVIITVLIALVRLIAYAGSSTPSVPYSSSYDSPSRYHPPRLDVPPSLFSDGGYAPPRTPGATSLKQTLLGQLDEARVHAWYMEGRDGGSKRIDYTKVAADIDAVTRAVEQDDCKAASAAMKKLKGRLAAGGGAAADDGGWDQVQALEAALGAYCAARSRAGGDAGPRVLLDAGRCGGTDNP
jgi:hypothetical protein